LGTVGRECGVECLGAGEGGELAVSAEHCMLILMK